MRLTTALCLLVLVGMSAATAKAGSIKNDPKIQINKCCDPVGDPTFPPPNAFSISHPLVITYAVPFSITYEYVGPTVMVPSAGHPDLFVEIKDIPNTGVTFTPGGNVFSGPFSTTFGGCDNPSCSLLNLIFGFSGGTLVHDDSYNVSVTPDVNSTPEPSTLLLFLSLGPAIGFARKRWNARLAV